MKLVQISTQSEWAAYHRIRRHVLFDLRGLTGYDDQHPDDRKPTHLPLIFVEGDDALGAVRLDLHEDGSGVVRTVAIVADRQRQGIGRSMMTAVESLAMARGAVRLEAHAAPDALRFYLKIGWEIIDAHQSNPLVAKTLR
ncbi:GNAT superfamily N-acetyltransferase [Agrobacterium tumefaciens]|uniref:GNAT family N-acetyltransferase n=1 Tax=Agrobacterium tumefaciens TaxID=358 RepID=UPI001AE884CE|nr:GNAT family N-acetyltransferase [Agrobacterium tumefaciens]MBP2572424.1 GNAT superfamily N-acetyltransferase [Agrobacterium tumefaciens]